MASSTTMTIRVQSDVKDKLDRLAQDTRRSKSFLAAEALAAYVDHELAILDGIGEALTDIEAGRLVPHEQAMDELDALIDAARQNLARGG